MFSGLLPHGSDTTVSNEAHAPHRTAMYVEARAVAIPEQISIMSAVLPRARIVSSAISPDRRCKQDETFAK